MHRVVVDTLSQTGVHEYGAGEYEGSEDAIATAKRIVDGSLAEFAARGRRGADLLDHYSLFGSHPRIVGEATDFSATEYAKQRSTEYEGESWYLYVDLGRYAEAEPLMLAGTEFEESYGGTTVARAEFYEQWGDAAADPAVAERAYREAERYYSIFASWSTSGGEGTARMADVNRVREKAKSKHAR